MKFNFGCWILAYFIFVLQKRCVKCVQAVASQIFTAIPCEGLRSDVLISHSDVFACSGQWSGHISSGGSQICNAGWHVCSWNDTESLREISWHEATRISGCFVINAAHNGISCRSCEENSLNGEMSAVGADCIRREASSKSCFGRGRMEASSHLVAEFLSCHHAPWISGMLCCLDKIKGSKPTITSPPKLNIKAVVGTNPSIECEAAGDPRPDYQWWKDGRRLPVLPAKYMLSAGMLTIVNANVDDEGFYQCTAQNKHGTAYSYKTQLRIIEATKSISAPGCKNSSWGTVLYRDEVAACGGRWHGHIKTASTQLCANGWRVCSVRDMRTLRGLEWSDVTSGLTGCYAYDAATTAFFPCSKCFSKRKGNRMSGVGSGCGNVDGRGYSCLKRGRIDVKSNGRILPLNSTVPYENKKLLRSCHYAQNVNTGVVCCKIHRQQPRTTSKRRRKSRRRCDDGCSDNSICSSNGRCRCRVGFKRRGGKCLERNKTQCGKRNCQNGSVCRRGKCECVDAFTGVSCERRNQLK